MKVTQDDLLEALKEALGRPEAGDGFTVAELMESTERNDEVVRRGLKKLAAAGRLEVTSKYRRNLAGVLQRAPAYKIIKAAKVQ